MTALRTWFDARSLREKRLLIVMAALAVVTLLWALVVRPVGDGLAGARERHADAVVEHGTVEAEVAAIRSARETRGAPLVGSLADAVRQRADAAGFALASLDEESPQRVRIAIQSARPAALASWVAGLEANGILVDSATWTDNHDQTVGVAMTLKARRP